MSGLPPAVILAGGRAVRMGGGDKCLLPLGNVSMLDRIIATLLPQVSEILVNTNSNPALFRGVPVGVRGDVLPGRLGPLAGIHTAMLWAQERGAEAVITVPGDAPFLPADLVARLVAASGDGHVAIASSAGNLHPVVGLWPRRLAPELQGCLESGMRRVRAWLEQCSFKIAEFEVKGLDPFWNINTKEDLQRAAQLGL